MSAGVASRDPIDPAGIAAMVEAARSRGAATLDEPEAFRIAAAMGIGVPKHRVIDHAGVTELDLDTFPGDRVVVKAILPGAAHKTEVGGVCVVSRSTEAIEAAIAGMRTTGARRFMVAEHVDHTTTPDAAAMLGMRWTDAFGPVVTLGPGGVYTALLSTAVPAVIVTPVLAGPGDIEAVLQQARLIDLLTTGFRGSAPAVTIEELQHLIRTAVELAARIIPDLVHEFEINPLVFTKAGPVALDAKARLGRPERGQAEGRPAELVARLLHPETLAIVGVSRRSNPGRVILRNVIAAGYPVERITVIKGGADRIEGCRCVPNLDSLPEPVDLLVVSVEAERAAEIVERAAGSGRVSAVVLVTGGIGERPGTAKLESRISRAAAESRQRNGLVVNGPNSLGLRSAPGRLDTFFIPGYKLSVGDAVDAPLAVIAQSGAFILSRLDRLPWLRPRYAISVGNQIDLTVGDYMEHFSHDEAVRVVACYLEGLRSGDGVAVLAGVRRTVARGGTVVLFAAGRTPAGADAAASHTASLAHDHRVTTELASVAGALVVDTLEGFDDQVMMALLLGDHRVVGNGLGVVGNAGFETVAVADAAGSLDLVHLAPQSTAAIASIVDSAGLGGLVSASNPLDLTPAADDAAFVAAVAAILDDPGVDVAIVGCVPFTPALQTLALSMEHPEDVALSTSVVGRLVALHHAKPWIAVVDGGALYAPMTNLLLSAGIPVFPTADRAARAFDQYVSWRLRNLAR